MFKKLLDRKRSDGGDSTLVSTIIVIPLLLVLFFSIIDTSIWLNNRALMTGLARDGARTVAIMGGTDSPLAHRYGNGDVEENIKRNLESTTGLIAVNPEYEVNCGPGLTSAVGAETYCDIEWIYDGVGLSIFALAAADEGLEDIEENALNYNNTRGTAESEVRF